MLELFPIVHRQILKIDVLSSISQSNNSLYYSWFKMCMFSIYHIHKNIELLTYYNWLGILMILQTIKNERLFIYDSHQIIFLKIESN